MNAYVTSLFSHYIWAALERSKKQSKNIYIAHHTSFSLCKVKDCSRAKLYYSVLILPGSYIIDGMRASLCWMCGQNVSRQAKRILAIPRTHPAN